MKIASIINYCTTDYRFIKKTIDSVRPFSSQIIVPVCNKFFDGTEENRELLNKTYEENVGIDFIEYEWEPNKGNKYWSHISRLLAVNNLYDDINWLMLMDSDEIIDTPIFMDFLKNTELNLMSYKIAGYFYFREPIYQSIKLEDPVVLCKRELVKPNVFDENYEREQYHDILNIPKQRMTTYNGLPMLHHYSWVRTKEQMLKKVRTWWHNKDRNWEKSVEEEFSRPFSGKDFVHGYEYKTVENKFNL